MNKKQIELIKLKRRAIKKYGLHLVYKEVLRLKRECHDKVKKIEDKLNDNHDMEFGYVSIDEYEDNIAVNVYSGGIIYLTEKELLNYKK